RTSEDFRTMVHWSPPDRSVVSPVIATSLANGFNLRAAGYPSGVRELEPGQSWRGWASVEVAEPRRRRRSAERGDRVAARDEEAAAADGRGQEVRQPLDRPVGLDLGARRAVAGAEAVERPVGLVDRPDGVARDDRRPGVEARTAPGDL